MIPIPCQRVLPAVYGPTDDLLPVEEREDDEQDQAPESHLGLAWQLLDS